MLSQTIFQPIFPFLPIGKEGGLKVVKGFGVVVVDEVTEFVDNYIFNATLRGFDQLSIKYDLSCRGATPPSFGHCADNDFG